MSATSQTELSTKSDFHTQFAIIAIFREMITPGIFSPATAYGSAWYPYPVSEENGSTSLCCVGWPRGRIVYDTTAGRFILYTDRRLQKADVIAALKSAFGLIDTDVVVKSDSHYR
jgi:hypothetical protein